MKLVILAAAIIIGKAVSDPMWMADHRLSLGSVVVVFGIWEAYEFWNKNKKQ